jgi:prepilin-type processing-associated H-X9-DG protein
VPVVGGVRAKARSTTCQSNLRQIGAAAQIFTAENKGRLPSISHQRSVEGESLSWTRTLRLYLGPDFIGRCPARPDHPAAVTYGWNDLLVTSDGAGIPFTACLTPSATLMIAEIPDAETAEHLHFSGAARGVTPAFFRTLVSVDCHGSSANYLFVDAHVANLGWPEIQRRLAGTKSPLVNP